jgi:hypothetical protein
MERSMSKDTLAVDFETKAKQLNEEMQKQSAYLGEINSTIKKLRNDRKVIQGNLSTMNGAIQAYSESARLVKEGENPEAV